MNRCPFSDGDDSPAAAPGARQTDSTGRSLSRRAFLTGGLAALGALTAVAAGASPLGTLVAHAVETTPWVERPFVGDSWEQCHALRDGQAFPQGGRPEEVDVVVIGGGISGLIAAYELAREHAVLVLEKEPTPGGNSRLGTWGGLRYPMGALYITKPNAEEAAFFKDIGLEANPIPGSADALYDRGQFVPHLFGEGVDHLPYSAEVRRAYKRAWKHFAAINDSDDYPDLPLTRSTRKARALDTMTFATYCRTHRIAPEPTALLDQYVRSCWGVGAEKVSAFAAINFLASEFDSLTAFPGGNGAISARVVSLLGSRVRTRCFVDRVTQDDGGVTVDYVRDGQPFRARARQAIMATPKHITRRMLADMPDPISTAMARARYGSYLVGAVFLREPLADKAFDLWVRNRWYSDLCLADWVSSGGHPAAHRKTVMVASIPMGESEGRAALLTTSHETFSKQLVSELEKDFPGCAGKIEGIQFARWGHPMAVPYPGWVTQVAPEFQKPFRRIWFANADTLGLACFESAFAAARAAAEGVHGALRHARSTRATKR